MVSYSDRRHTVSGTSPEKFLTKGQWNAAFVILAKTAGIILVLFGEAKRKVYYNIYISGRSLKEKFLTLTHQIMLVSEPLGVHAEEETALSQVSVPKLLGNFKKYGTQVLQSWGLDYSIPCCLVFEISQDALWTLLNFI